MRTTSLLVLILLVVNLYGQDYTKQMEVLLDKTYQSKDINDLTTVAKSFEQIGRAESDQWLPYYYSAYAKTAILFYDKDLEDDAKDLILDEVQTYLDQALKLDDDQSEIYALQALIHQMRIFKASRGRIYSIKANEAISKGLTLDSNNPRLYYLKGLNIYYTPEPFGGGVKRAKVLFEKADSLFKQQESRDRKILPSWGGDENHSFLSKCSTVE